jgi:hypothetical protein
MGQGLQDHGARDDDIGTSGFEAFVPFVGVSLALGFILAPSA